MDRIKFSSEIPPKVLMATPQLLDYLDYDFVIASMYLQSKRYGDYYLTHRRPGTILDNGAFEMGKSISVKNYFKVIDKLRPEVVVLPDVRQDWSKTCDMMGDFVDTMPRRYESQYKFMGVLQGKSYEEWECLLYHYQRLEFDIVGIPYGTLDRINFIRTHPKVKFHALGLQYFPELLSLRLLKNVVSIDTSLPVKYASRQKLLRNLDLVTVGKRPNFKKGFNSRQTVCLISNLEFVRDVCDRTNNFPLKRRR